MSKFANVIRGKRAESDPVKVPGYDDFSVLMTPLTGAEQIAAYAWGQKHATEKEIPSPGEGNPVYDLAVMAAVVFYGALDPDSPHETRARSFESPGEILEHMAPEAIVYLHQQHLVWQQECSPTTRLDGTPEALEAMVREVAGPEGRAAFMRQSPSTQVAFTLSTTRQLVSLLSSKSSSTSGSSRTPRSGARPARQPRKKRRRKSGT